MVSPLLISAGLGAIEALGQGKGGGSQLAGRTVPVNVASSTQVPIPTLEELTSGQLSFGTSPGFSVPVSSGFGPSSLDAPENQGAKLLGLLLTREGGMGKGGGLEGGEPRIQPLSSIGSRLTAG